MDPWILVIIQHLQKMKETVSGIVLMIKMSIELKMLFQILLIFCFTRKNKYNFIVKMKKDVQNGCIPCLAFVTFIFTTICCWPCNKIKEEAEKKSNNEAIKNYMLDL
jgi:hypothetical protein